MSSYPASIRRCQHIKVNGTQCGSPALRDEKYCYFHMRWHASKMSVILKQREHWIAGLPTLEDANSIQVVLAEVMRLLVTQEVDHKTGALLLYAMQTASANLKRTSFEPEPTRVVIDRDCVAQRPLGQRHGRPSPGASMTRWKRPMWCKTIRRKRWLILKRRRGAEGLWRTSTV